MIARLLTPLRRLHASLVMGRKARVDCFQTVADLLDAGFELERALDVTARALGGRGARARLIGSWRRALPASRFAEAMAASVPAAEAMIFEAYGRVDAGRLFAAASRVAELRERQMAAVRKALAMPLLLAVALVLMLWAAEAGSCRCWRPWCRPSAGGRRRRSSASPLSGCTTIPRHWPRSLPPWRYRSDWPWCTGPGGTEALDRIAPFSLYRTVTGSAFLFVVLEFWARGSTSTTAPSRDLKRRAAPTPGTASAPSSATWCGAPGSAAP